MQTHFLSPFYTARSRRECYSVIAKYEHGMRGNVVPHLTRAAEVVTKLNLFLCKKGEPTGRDKGVTL